MKREFIPASDIAVRWSDRQAELAAQGDERALAKELWPLDELNQAQRMICAGDSIVAIAEALGRPVQSVRIKLEQTGYV